MSRNNDNLRDYPRALLELMAEEALRNNNQALLAEIEAALPHAADYAIDHRAPEDRSNR